MFVSRTKFYSKTYQYINSLIDIRNNCSIAQSNSLCSSFSLFFPPLFVDCNWHDLLQVFGNKPSVRFKHSGYQRTQICATAVHKPLAGSFVCIGTRNFDVLNSINTYTVYGKCIGIEIEKRLTARKLFDSCLTHFLGLFYNRMHQRNCAVSISKLIQIVHMNCLLTQHDVRSILN